MRGDAQWGSLNRPGKRPVRGRQRGARMHGRNGEGARMHRRDGGGGTRDLGVSEGILNLAYLGGNGYVLARAKGYGPSC